MQTIDNTELTVPLATLKAVATHAAKQDIRYYLNGVCFNPRAGNGNAGLIMATDGHRLIVCEGMTVTGYSTPRPCPAFILDNDSIAAIISAHKGMPKKANPDVTFIYKQTADGNVKHVPEIAVKTPIGVLTFRPVDGVFPDVSRVIPKSSDIREQNEPGFYNNSYVNEAIKAIELFTESKLSYTWPIFQRGQSASGLMRAENNAGHRLLIVIMPIRVAVDDLDPAIIGGVVDGIHGQLSQVNCEK